MTTRQAKNSSIPTVIFLLRQCAELGRGIEASAIQKTDKCMSNQGLHHAAGIGTLFALECVAHCGG
jgi:hypothetical protein